MIRNTFLAVILILCLIFVPGSKAEELPVPSFDNAVVISIEHIITNSPEIDYILNNFNFGMYAWLSFSYTLLNPELAWYSDWNNASAGIQDFKDRLDLFIGAAQRRGVKLHIVLGGGLARRVENYEDAKREDIRNAQWYNDNKIASDTQIAGIFIEQKSVFGRIAGLSSSASPSLLDTYVFGTLSRYARKMHTNLEAKAKATLAFLKQRMDQYPEVIVAISGWGESELNYHRINHAQYQQDYFCDFSPFAILEFRDWIKHEGLYNNATGPYRGEGYSGGGARYQGSGGLAQFNQDFGTNFTTWDLRYYNWNLNDDYDTNPNDLSNPDPNKIPFTSYSHGNMMPSSGGSYIAGGFDPPRTMSPQSNPFWELWNLFRETMVYHHVVDVARWASEAGIPPERWYSHQIPADHLFGTNASTPLKNARYYSSASPLWTADIQPYGSPGITVYDLKFPDWFARTSDFAVPTMSALASNWAIMEYDAEAYPQGMSVTPSSSEVILDQYMRSYSYNAHLINFWRWIDGSGESQIKGTNKEIALRNFIQSVRDKARWPVTTVLTPPQVGGVTATYASSMTAASDSTDPFVRAAASVQINIREQIWEGEPWSWTDWGDFGSFKIYRDYVSGFTPGPANLIATTRSFSYSDDEIAAGNVLYYKIQATNINGDPGPTSEQLLVSPSSTTPLPILALDRTALTFNLRQIGALNTQVVNVSNQGPAGTVLNWTASADQAWITVTPTAGQGDGQIQITVNPTGLVPNTYTGQVRVDAAGALSSPQFIAVTLNVVASGGTELPFGSFDTPVADSTVFGSVPVTGWVLDDTGIDRVEIKRDPTPSDPAEVIGEDGTIYIGVANFVKGARPDVENLYPEFPQSDRAGWGYMILTNFLPNGGNGAFTLYAIAFDIDGNRVELGRKPIICDNANSVYPFGTIDTPSQGGTASGSNYINFGWALTPAPKFIPTDGSTIEVLIDGKKYGNVVYNQYREDVANAFPGYANSGGPIGYHYINTLLFENGVHTISWIVTDSDSIASGIGSRYFEIQNNSQTEATKSAFSSIALLEDTSSALSIGFEGNPHLRIEETEVLKVQLQGEGGFTFVGWGRDESRALPVGSTLDKTSGTFYWQPGPGFLGIHELHFAVTDGLYKSRPQKLIIEIVPKSFAQKYMPEDPDGENPRNEKSIKK